VPNALKPAQEESHVASRRIANVPLSLWDDLALQASLWRQAAESIFALQALHCRASLKKAEPTNSKRTMVSGNKEPLLAAMLD
jgi:hypothetical protein